MNNKSNPRQILEKVNKLAFADISCYELLSFGNEACSAIGRQGANELNARFKDRMLQIRDKQIRPLLDEDLLEEERQVMFTDAKENLALLLSEYLATGKSFANGAE